MVDENSRDHRTKENLTRGSVDVRFESTSQRRINRICWLLLAVRMGAQSSRKGYFFRRLTFRECAIVTHVALQDVCRYFSGDDIDDTHSFNATETNQPLGIFPQLGVCHELAAYVGSGGATHPNGFISTRKVLP